MTDQPLRRVPRRPMTLLVLLIVAFSASGCFQSASDLEAQSIDTRDLPSATPTSTETPTDTPTLDETQIAALTNVNTETPTPTSSSSASPTATSTLTLTPTPGATEVAQEVTQDPGEDDPFVQATTLIAEPTLTSQALTNEAQATFEVVVTDTPQFTFTPSLTPTTETTGPTIPGGSCEHEVRRGDTLFSLSRYYGLDIDVIVADNAIVNPNLIIAGDKLIIRGCGTTGNPPPATSVPVPGAGQGNVGVPGGSAGGIQVRVEQGQTLYQLSVQYNVPIASILAANPQITNPNLIFYYDLITIP